MARQPKSGSKRRRAKKRRGGSDAGAAEPAGGGAMQSMVSGFRKAVGVDRAGAKKKKKGSPLGNVLWLLVIAAAVGMLLYRYTQ